MLKASATAEFSAFADDRARRASWGRRSSREDRWRLSFARMAQPGTVRQDRGGHYANRTGRADPTHRKGGYHDGPQGRSQGKPGIHERGIQRHADGRMTVADHGDDAVLLCWEEAPRAEAPKNQEGR